MKTYVYVNMGLVYQIIPPITYSADVITEAVDASGNVTYTQHHAGDEVLIEDRFTPEFLATVYDITGLSPVPQQGWTYDGTTFAPYVVPPPTPAQILATNTATRNALLLNAGNAMAPLQDAVDIGEATDADTALLLKWKTYRVAVNRVDLTVSAPVWTVAPDLSSYS